MGGGPVLWLETEDEEEDSDEDEQEDDEDRDREWSLGSALKAASPGMEDRGEKKGRSCEGETQTRCRMIIKFNTYSTEVRKSLHLNRNSPKRCEPKSAVSTRTFLSAPER